MLYSEYSRKMAKVAVALNFVGKYKFVIIAVIAAILAIVATLLGTRGLVFDRHECPATIEYGTDFPYRAGAFLGDVRYEFRAADGGEWTGETPTRAGKYLVRAVSSRTGGANSYGEVHEFEIVPKVTDIVIADSVVYGEIPDCTAELAYGDRLVCEKFEYHDLSQTATEVRAVVSEVKAIAANGDDVTSSYSFVSRYDTIVFKPREIEITVPDAVSEYDGMPFSSSKYEITGGSLADGDALVTVFDITQTDVGSVDNTPTITVERAVLNSEGKNVTANYRSKSVVGKLTVEKREVVVRTLDASHVYDGNEFSSADFEIADGYTLAGNDMLVPVLSEKITDVGSTKNRVMFEVHGADGTDLSHNYSIVLDAGELSVTKRDITVTTGSADKIYDATPLFCEKFTVENLVDGHEFSVTKHAELTDADECDNVLEGVVKTADGKTDKSDNYNIIWVYGTLTVSKRNITVKTGSTQWVYDGKSHDLYGNDEYKNLLAVHHLVVREYTTLTNVVRDEAGNVRSVDNVIVFAVEDGGGNDVTDNYNIAVEYGTLVVTPREVELQVESNGFVYDGKPHSDPRVQIVAGTSFADGHTYATHDATVITDVAFDSRGNVVSVPNNVTVTVADGEGGDVTDNYSILIAPGSLTVFKRDITIVAGDLEKEYDGTPLTNNAAAYTVIEGTNSGLASGQEISSLEFVPTSITDACSATHRIDKSSVIITVKATGADVTRNYEVTVTDGVLTVTPRLLEITTKDGEWIYDGKTHGESIPESVGGSGLASGHSLAIDSYTPVTDVLRDDDGKPTSVKNVCSYKIVGTKQENYILKYTYGKLLIKPREITVETASNEWVYDGNGHKDTGVKIIAGTLADGQGIRSSSAKVVYNVGEYENHISAEVLHVNGQNPDGTPKFYYPDETNNYDIAYVYGTLEITPRKITVKTATNEWLYDGKEHFDEGIEITEGSLVLDHELRITSHTSMTDVKRDDDGEVLSDENILGITVVGTTHGDFDVNDNYDLTVEYGTLEIDPIAVTVEPHSEITMLYGTRFWALAYDIPSSPDGYYVAGQRGFPEYAYIADDGSQVPFDLRGYDYLPAGTYTYVFTGLSVIESDTGTDKTHNYDITINDKTGKLIIRKRVIVLAMDDESRVYNGRGQRPSMTPSIVKDSSDVLADYEYVACKFDADCLLTDVGTIAKKVDISVVHDDVEGRKYDVTSNYEISVNDATFSVTPRPVEIVGSDASKVYDDTPLTAGAYARGIADDENSGLVGGHSFSCEMTADSTITYVGFAANKVKRGTVKITDGENIDVTRNYAIAYADGTLAVLPRYIFVVPTYKEKVYDGKPLTSDEVDYRYGYGADVGDGCGSDFIHMPIVEGQTATWKCDGSITDVGFADNNVDLYNSRIYDRNGKDVTDQYHICVGTGELAVTPRKVTVGTNSKRKTYDGKAITGGLSQDAFIVRTIDGDADTGLIDGHRVGEWIESLISFVDYTETDGVPGVDNVVVLGSILDADGNDVTGNYVVEYDYGRLVIDKRDVFVATATNSWDYDGAEHFDLSFTVTDGSFVDDEIVYIEYNAVILEPGTIDNVLTLVVIRKRDGEEKNSTENYNICYELGTLTVRGGDDPDDGEGPGGMGDPLDAELLKVTADYSGSVYLRLMSFADYDGTVQWSEADDYGGQAINYDGKNYSVNNLTEDVLKRAGATAVGLRIELIEKAYASVLPYYTTLDTSPVYESDVRYTGSADVYEVKHYLYDYTADDGKLLFSVQPSPTRAAVEKKYREYVHANYSGVRESTAEYLRTFIADNKLKADDPAIVSKVASVIRKAAKYDMKYDTALDDTGDVAVSFLRDYKTGVCRHYATAATLVYRMLGFPARYTVGILADTEAGEEVLVKGDRGHAWVEVYIDGIGWVNVEVTGGGANGDGSGDGEPGGDEPGGEDPDDNKKPQLTIMPVDTVGEYNGTELFAIQKVTTPESETVRVEELVASGYTYTVAIDGSRIEVGDTETTVTAFTLFDADGVDVTDNFNIVYMPGILMVTKTQIHVAVPTLTKIYDGTPLVFSELLPGTGYYGVRVTGKPAGVGRVEIDMAAFTGITEAGALVGLELSIKFAEIGAIRVYGESGADVTDNYTVIFDEGGLVVERRKLTIVAGSASKVYDGEPLTCEDYTVRLGTLVAGHTLTVKTSGAIIDVGKGYNEIREVFVYAGDVNVGNNYEVIAIDGVLEITR